MTYALGSRLAALCRLAGVIWVADREFRALECRLAALWGSVGIGGVMVEITGWKREGERKVPKLCSYLEIALPYIIILNDVVAYLKNKFNRLLMRSLCCLFHLFT